MTTEITKLDGLEIEQIEFSDNYVQDVKDIIFAAQKKSYRAVNSIMIQAYWLIGYRIVEQELNGKDRAKYGEKIIEKLSRELNHQIGSGMSVAHLKNCRQFYTVFPDFPKRYTVCSQLSWSHLRLIMRLDSSQERDFYIEESKNGAWSVRELERNIKTQYFQRILSNQHIEIKKENKNLTQIKDPYVLEFLGIKPDTKFTERDLETALINHLEKFLLELGKGFSFVERQMHIKTETSDFYIDLVFYNYILKCFVLIDLKIGKLTHQDIGQMDMYVRMFDSLKKADDDNPTVGIIFCNTKDDSIVKYSVLSENEQLFASKYKMVLPSEEELAKELENNKNLY